MYKIYIDRSILKADRTWKKLKEYPECEEIIYDGFSDLILKLNINDKNIVFLNDFKTQNDCYDKIKILRGKFPLSVVNVVSDSKLNLSELKRVGLNEMLPSNKTKTILSVFEQSLRLADSYANENYVHVDDSAKLSVKKDVNLIAVIGASGAVGKTTIATNLAASYAEFGLKVCLVDFSLQFGDVGLFTNVKPKFTVYDLAVNNLDSNPNLNLFIEHINPNFFVLPAPVLPEQADYVNRTMASKMIKIIGMAFDVVIFDTGSVVNDLNLELFKLCQQVILVTTKDISSLKNTKLMMDILSKLKIDSKVKLVINRHNSPKYVVENDAVKKMLNADVISLIPEEEYLVSNSINMGVPLIYSYPNEKISDEIRLLMSTVRYNCLVGETSLEKK